jgi:hypothetical protein
MLVVVRGVKTQQWRPRGDGPHGASGDGFRFVPTGPPYTSGKIMPASAPMGRRSTVSLSSFAARVAKVFREKASGTQADRRQLLRLLQAVARGDVVIVPRIDRAARSTFDLFAIVKQILAAGGQFSSLAEPLAHPHGGKPTPGENARAAYGPAPKLTDAQKTEARRRRVEGPPSGIWQTATPWAEGRFHGCGISNMWPLSLKAGSK